MVGGAALATYPATAPIPTDAYKLTDKQAAFVREYLSNGYNGTQAALAAGYSPDCARQQASDNLSHPHIAAVIEAKRQSLAERCGLTGELIVSGLLREAQGLGPDTNAAARNRAYELLSKVIGMDVMQQGDSNAGGLSIIISRADRGAPGGAVASHAGSDVIEIAARPVSSIDPADTA